MAITGSGTEADPYIVHSYDEIAYVMTNYLSSARVYMLLANDIDCNTYGSTFEWQQLNFPQGYNIGFNLDLGGYTIKTFKIRENNAMFGVHGGNGHEATIKNGKILNMFAGRSKGLFAYTTGVYKQSILDNVSISMSLETGLIDAYVAIDAAIKNSSIYIEGSWTSGHQDSGLLWHRGSDAGGFIVDSDFLVDVNLGETRFDKGNGTTERCRFRGSCIGGAKYNGVLGGKLMNCVVDLDLDISTSYRLCHDQNSNGIVNEDKIPSGFNVCGLTKVTSQEIINGASLRAKGFEVTNVVGG